MRDTKLEEKALELWSSSNNTAWFDNLERARKFAAGVQGFINDCGFDDDDYYELNDSATESDKKYYVFVVNDRQQVVVASTNMGAL